MAMLISIDNGGTLTDACVIRGSETYRAKALTTPHDLTKCFVEVLSRASESIYGEPNLSALLEEVDYIRYSTTQGTNAVVQRKGPRVGLVMRAGQTTKALLRNADETDLFATLVGDRVATLDPTLEGEALEQSVIEVINDLMARGANRLVISLGGSSLIRDEIRVKQITLQHYPRHMLGAIPLLFSHQLSDDRDDARRTWSSLLNSFLDPAMERFLYGAERVLRTHRARNPMLIFCNDGTSSRVAKTVALKTWGSGPRGGMQGAAALARHYDRKAVVTIDVGGTTTDIGAVLNGEIAERRWGTLENIEISFPLCEVQSIGVGGSSVFRVVKEALRVGPESVGSAPGPACFGYGGSEPTITDAYLLLGLFDPDSYFGGQLKLDAARARAVIEEKVSSPLNINLDAALLRMEQAYIDKMAGGLRPLIDNAKDTTLLAFGGGGPISACRVADELGVREIIVPCMAAVFSAFGIGFSDIAHSYEGAMKKNDDATLAKLLDGFRQAAQRDMFAEGFDLSECKLEKSITYSRNGQQTIHALNSKAKVPAGLAKTGELRAQLRAVKEIPHFALKPVGASRKRSAESQGTRVVQLPVKGALETSVLPMFRYEALSAGAAAAGPAIVEDEYFTCFVAPGWQFMVNRNRDLVLQKAK